MDKAAYDPDNDPSVEFGDEQTAKIIEGLRQFRRGEAFSQEEVRELARRKAQSWLKPESA